MRVLSFSSCFPSSRNPTPGVFVLRRLAALARRVDLEVVHPKGWFPLLRRRARETPEERLSGIRVHHRPFLYVPNILKRFDGRLYAAGLRQWVTEYCDSHAVDLMDAHFVWPDGVAVSHLARHTGLPYTLTLRGTLNSRCRKRGFRSQIASALRGAAAVISVSRPMADLAAELGANPEHLHVIPNGVDLDVFRPVPRSKARRQLGLSLEGSLLVSVGHILPEKGFTELIEAVTQLPDTTRLAIIGGDTLHRRYAGRLRRLVRQRGLGGRVSFAGVQPPEVVAAYLSAADVSVLASYSEGCPNVVLESLACGTPVVATNVGAVPDIVRPGETGELVEPKHVDQLADVLNSALDRRWSREAVRQSVANRSWDDVASSVYGVWTGIVHRETNPPDASTARCGDTADIV